VNRLMRQTLMLLCIFGMLGVSGCKSSRVVFVSESDGLVRLGPDVRGHVYFWNGSAWELSGNKVDLPEGWFTGPIDLKVEAAN